MNARNLRVAVFAAMILAFATAATAAESFSVRAKIPFDFVVNDQSFPAGEYVLTVNGIAGRSIVMLEGPDRNVLSLINTIAWDGRDKYADPYLIFRGYDQRYFLSSLWTGGLGTGREFPRCRQERSILADLGTRTPTQIAQVSMIRIAGR